MNSCQDTLAPDDIMCNEAHCNTFSYSSNFHRICTCEKWDANSQQWVPLPNCNPKDSNYPVQTTVCYNQVTHEQRAISPAACTQLIRQDANWLSTSCYCCCTCFANGTLITVPEGKTKAIETLGIGEMIVTSKVSGKRGKLKFDWKPAKVSFSNGTGPKSTEPVMIYIEFGDTNHLIVTPDHLFLMSNGKLKRADKLAPAKDDLVLSDGTTTHINKITIGQYVGGVHHIATTVEDLAHFKGTVDDHLLVAAGVVTGDYLLQMFQKSDKMKDLMDDGHDNLPTLGTQAYVNTHVHLNATQYFAEDKSTKTGLTKNPLFKSYTKSSTHIPDHALHFVNKKQEEDINNNPQTVKRPFSNKAGMSTVKYLFSLYKSFYPDINFYLDWEKTELNAYSFVHYGQKHVIVSGGLVRTGCLQMEGLAVIIAHEIGHLIGGSPDDVNGFSCEAQSDYFGIGVVMREVFYLKFWNQVLTPGLEQLTQYFQLISTGNAAPINKDICKYPGIQCRLDAMNAAMMGDDLPRCAGGTTTTSLQLLGDEIGQSDKGEKYVILKFNMPVAKATAEDLKNYAIDPACKLTSAKVLDDVTRVMIIGEFETDTEYTITVSKVYGADGSGLDLTKSTARFEGL
jgi:hypothetical protein